MPLFEYRAKTKGGKIIEGMIEAPLLSMAEETLVDDGLEVLGIKEQHSNFLLKYFSWDPFSRVSFKDLVVFSRQLSVMLSATVPLVKALRLIVKQTSSSRLTSVVSEIADDVESGMKLSLAFSRHPGVFDEFFISMVRSGETSGKLGEVLTFLADQLEKDYDLNNKIFGALIYPAVIVIGMTCVGAYMMIKVVPNLLMFAKESGATLPLSTRILIAVSDFFVNYWLFLLLGIIISIFAIMYYVSTPNGRVVKDKIVLEIPILKKILERIYLVRFSRTMSSLIVGKVPMTVALEVTSGVVQNLVYRDLIKQTITEVEDGNSIVSVFSKSDKIPVMFSNMLVIGEQTGRLEEILQKMTDFYTREVDYLVGNLVSLITPIIIIVIGLAVGVMVAAIILPMYTLVAV